MYELSGLCLFFLHSFIYFLKYEEGNLEELVRLVSKRVECAHETEQWLYLSLGNHPMLFE